MDDDRISQLPEAIAHHVLSFLNNSPKALFRMSVLSKDWFAITAAFPILDFNLYNFTRDVKASRVLYDGSYMDMFFKYVENTTCRFCNQQNNVNTFNLNGGMLENPSQLPIIDTCIGLVVRKGGMQVFHININTVSPLPKYRLPNILLSVSSLSSLIIQHCELPSSLMVDDAIKFKSLKVLLLERVNINEQEIMRLTTCCDLLENIMLIECYGFKRFCIYGCQNLQKVTLDCINEVERIDIDAPNLWYLYLQIWGHQGGAPSMKLSSSKKLTSLYYSGDPLPKLEGSTDFLSNFPFIENLVLSYLQHNLKLSSHSLKTLVLHPSCDLNVIDIDAPNLVSLKFSCASVLSELLARNSAKSEAQMEWFSSHFVNAIWFIKLWRFLNKTPGFFKVLKLHICSSFMDVEELKAIDYPLYELELVEVELKVIDSKLATIKKFMGYVASVDALFWCLRPRSLTLKSDFHFLDIGHRRQVIKFTYEKLLLQEDEGWTGIQIEFSVSSSKAKKHFNDLNSLLAALPRDRVRHIITLTKVQGT